MIQPHPNPNESDVGGTSAEYAQLALELGRVGYEEDDDSTYYDQGTGDNDGRTLINVQLYRGRNPNVEPKDAAQGHRIVACASGMLWMIPPRGTEVLVAFAGGMELVPGAATIIATRGASPGIQFGPKKAKLELPKDYDLVIKARSITLTDYQNRLFVMGPEFGITAVDNAGNGWAVQGGNFIGFASQSGDVKSLLRVEPTMIVLFQKDGSALKLAGGNGTLAATQLSLAAGSLLLGQNASPATPIAIGPQPGLVSTTVFGQP